MRYTNQKLRLKDSSATKRTKLIKVGIIPIRGKEDVLAALIIKDAKKIFFDSFSDINIEQLFEKKDMANSFMAKRQEIFGDFADISSFFDIDEVSLSYLSENKPVIFSKYKNLIHSREDYMFKKDKKKINEGFRFKIFKSLANRSYKDDIQKFIIFYKDKFSNYFFLDGDSVIIRDSNKVRELEFFSRRCEDYISEYDKMKILKEYRDMFFDFIKVNGRVSKDSYAIFAKLFDIGKKSEEKGESKNA